VSGKIGRVGVLSSKVKLGKMAKKAGVVHSQFNHTNIFVSPNPSRSTLKVAKYYRNVYNMTRRKLI
jgi:hypothetical protein